VTTDGVSAQARRASASSRAIKGWGVSFSHIEACVSRCRQRNTREVPPPLAATRSRSQRAASSWRRAGNSSHQPSTSAPNRTTSRSRTSGATQANSLNTSPAGDRCSSCASYEHGPRTPHHISLSRFVKINRVRLPNTALRIIDAYQSRGRQPPGDALGPAHPRRGPLPAFCRRAGPNDQ
jgi:hypothetical protein